MTEHIVTLMSGGLDSAVTLEAARGKHPGAKITCLYVDYGNRTAKQERFAAYHLLAYYGAEMEQAHLDAPWLSSHQLVRSDAQSLAAGSDLAEEAGNPNADVRGFVIPLRNMIFASMGCSLAVHLGAKELWVGWDHCGDARSTGDKSPEFAFALKHATEVGVEPTQSPVDVISPLFGNTTTDTMRMAVERGVPLHLTWSCYNDFDKQCGFCTPCVARRRAAEKLDIDQGITFLDEAYARRQLGLTACR